MPDLDRFVSAQNGVWPTALAELKAGRKATHWMWFIFPQLRSLGRSGTAKFYGIEDLDEARDYLAHPVLGPRLIEAAQAVTAHEDLDAESIMGPVDALKLRSSATLFLRAGAPEMQKVLDRFYDGKGCALTLAELKGAT